MTTVRYMSLPFFNISVPVILPDNASVYGYRPNEKVAIIFIALFGLSCLLHIGQALHRKTWFMLFTAVICAALEVAGWSARLWSNKQLFNFAPFKMQIVTTILAPSPLIAADFVILEKIIQLLGSDFSRLRPRQYCILFCAFDVVSLSVQGVGGALASMALHGGNPNIGARIMLIGIAFQVFTMILYMICGTEFLIRYCRNYPFHGRLTSSSTDSLELAIIKPNERGEMTTRIRVMICALIFNTLCLFVRSIYRVLELSQGWTGRIIRTQIYFIALDASMVVLALYTLNVVHPGIFLSKPTPRTTGDFYQLDASDSRDSSIELAPEKVNSFM